MSKATQAILYARQELGSPYIFGAEGPDAFDCSGLIQWVYGRAGIATPRIAEQQQRWATPVARPAQGDLVFYGAPAYHVGLYIGAGKMIHAPNSRSRVRIDPIDDANRTPTSYGRVPGSGAGVTDAIANTASTSYRWLAALLALFWLRLRSRLTPTPSTGGTR